MGTLWRFVAASFVVVLLAATALSTPIGAKKGEGTLSLLKDLHKTFEPTFEPDENADILGFKMPKDVAIDPQKVLDKYDVKDPGFLFERFFPSLPVMDVKRRLESLHKTVKSLRKVDPVLINTYYGHGGWMGYAPLMLTNPLWTRIALRLDPQFGGYVKSCFDIKQDFNLKQAILGAENSPIVAAYGYLLERAGHTRASGAPFEMDVFVHPSATVKEPLADDILLAHGKGASDLKMEREGKSAYEQVKQRKTYELGGLKLREWVTRFTRAVALSRLQDAGGPTSNANALVLSKISAMSQDPKTAADYAFERILRKPFTWSWFVDVWQSTNPVRPYMSVILDMKSAAPRSDMILSLVEQLNLRGIVVEAVGSFSYTQIQGVPFYRNKQFFKHKGKKIPTQQGAPMPVLFFHGFYGVIVKAVNPQPQLLDKRESLPFRHMSKSWGVMFNAGFLLDSKLEVRDKEIAGLRQLRKDYGFSLGVYVQEFDLGIPALEKLNDIVSTKRMGMGRRIAESVKEIFRKAGSLWRSDSTKTPGHLEGPSHFTFGQRDRTYLFDLGFAFGGPRSEWYSAAPKKARGLDQQHWLADL